uniref:ribosomal protein L14 n=1 Tax=Haslea karadagensis TaxID=1146996 RepID=UPI002200B46B|nr:ribosomal protein L14 [Haslea karadagensis]UXN44278.1 ribosomal protein L14 [Haslea karadagensis]UXN44359.1 ribosomal protein L14 [Haslea karadagensis]
MIQQQTILKAADNSGAKIVQCIKVLGGYKKKYAKLGDIIVVSVKQLRNRSKLTSKVKKGEVHKALVIRTNTKQQKKDGSYNFFNKKLSNAVVLINKKGTPIATRITEPIPVSLKKKQFMKFISISPGLI